MNPIEQKEKLLHFGPLELNAATHELQNIVQDLLRGSSATCTYGPLGLEMKIGEKEHNISLLLENADLTQLVLDRDDIVKYSDILMPNIQHKSSLMWGFPKPVGSSEQSKEFNVQQLPGLEAEEIQAIKFYTHNTHNSTKINSFLRSNGQLTDEDKNEIKQDSRLQSEYVTQLLLVSMIAISGLNRTSGDKPPIPENQVAMRGETVYLPALVVNERLKAIVEYKKKNYASSITDTKALTSTSEILYKYLILPNENSEIDALNSIGFYATDDYVVVKVKADRSIGLRKKSIASKIKSEIKIDKTDPLWSIIKTAMGNNEWNPTVDEEKFILNHPELKSLIQAIIGGFSGKYKTKFTDLIGRDIQAIASYPQEKEILMPPVPIQWTDVRIGGDCDIYIMAEKVDNDEDMLDLFKQKLSLPQKTSLYVVANNAIYAVNKELNSGISMQKLDGGAWLQDIINNKKIDTRICLTADERTTITLNTNHTFGEDIVYFSGHPVNVVEMQKDTNIIRGYNALKSLQTDINTLAELQKTLQLKLDNLNNDEINSESDIWQKSVFALFKNYTERLHKIAIAPLTWISSIEELKANAAKIIEQANNLKEISRILNNKEIILLHEINSALQSLIAKTPFFTTERGELLEIQDKIGDLLRQPQTISHNDLFELEQNMSKLVLNYKNTQADLFVILKKLHEEMDLGQVEAIPAKKQFLDF